MREVLSPDGYLFHTKKGKPVELPMSSVPLADTHGHLTSFRKIDPSVAIARAALVGVRLLAVPVDPSDDVPDVAAFVEWFKRTVDEAARLLESCAMSGHVPPTFAGEKECLQLTDNVWFLAGVHPYGAGKFLDDASVRERLLALLQDDRCVGVGEFGIDYGPWNEVEPEAQIEALRAQLRIAHELGMPVELHVRDAKDDEGAKAHEDVLRVLGEEGVPQAGCDLHCFTSDPRVMQPFVELGCMVAFGGAVTFAKSDDIRDAVAACPEYLLLSETDAPYMAPVPLRGSECEPAMVAFNAARIVSVREERGIASAGQTYEALWHNACVFLGMC